MGRGSSLASIIETNILNYLSIVVKSFHECLKALSFQKESVLSENVENFIMQVENSSVVANNAVCYKKTADALIGDIKKESFTVDSGFFSKVARFEDEIEELKSKYNRSYTVLKDKIKELMDKYDKKMSEFSKISKTLNKDSNSFYHLSEMLDVSV